MSDPRRDHATTQIFDGSSWAGCRGSAGIPGLVDLSCGLAGYRERVTDDVSDAPRAIARLLDANGIVAVRDRGSGLDAAYRFAAVQHGRVTVVGAGPVLVDGPAGSEWDRPIQNRSDLLRTLDSLASEAVEWINVKPTAIEFIESVGSQAHARGLRVAVRGQLSAESAIQGHANLVEDMLSVVRQSQEGATTAELLIAGLGGSSDRIQALMRRICEAGVGIGTGLVALHRAVFPKAAASAPMLDQLEPILPHSRYLAQMARGVGFLAGRRALAQHAGLTQPRPAQLRAAEDAWRTLLELVAAAISDGMGVFPASRAPQLAVLPGYGLKEEMAVLVEAGADVDAVLAAATGRACAFLGLPKETLLSPQLWADDRPRTATDLLDLRLRGGSDLSGSPSLEGLRWSNASAQGQ